MKKNNFKLLTFCIIYFFVIESNAQVVSTYAGTGVASLLNGSISLATFDKPHGVYISPTGDIYIADQQNHSIRKISSTGVVSTFAGTGASGSANGTSTSASFYNPRGICADAAGNLYIADCFNHKIRKITPAGVVTNFAGSGVAGSANGTGAAASFNGARGICADASGNLYVADEANHKIRKITPAGVVTTFAGIATSGANDGPGTTASFFNPRGICIDGSGNFYVADTYNNSIRKISPTGVVSTLAGSGAYASIDGVGTAASFSSPSSVYVNSSGEIFVCDQGNPSIRKVTSTGVVTTIAGSGVTGSVDGIGAAASFNAPLGLCINALGDIYVADFGNNKIRKISACAAPLAPTNTTLSNNQTLCENNTTILSATSSGTVNWYATPNSTTVLASGASYTTSALASGSYTYYAEASTCTVSDTRTAITVTVNPAPTISVNSGSICSGTSFTINPSGANTYTYSGGSAIVTPTITTSYSITGTSAEGCLSLNTAISSVTLNADPTITVNSGAICSGSSFTINPTGANTFTISGGSSVVTPTSNTSYSVTGTSIDGCLSSNTSVSTVTVYALPSLSVTSTNSLICTGESATLTVTGGNTYTWNTAQNINAISISPTVTTTYTVHGIDANGCQNTSTITQSVSLCTGISSLQKENLISIYPNPSNDIFTVSGIDANTTIIVYNLFGKLILSISSENTFKTIDLADCSNGIYFIKVRKSNKELIQKIIKQ